LTSIFHCVRAYSRTLFQVDTCEADFRALKWRNPKYPELFYEYGQDTEFYYGVILPEPLNEKFQKDIHFKPNNNWNKFRKKTTKRDHTRQLDIRVKGWYLGEEPKTIFNSHRREHFGMRLAANYYRFHRVRWVHTLATRTIHPATGYFLKNPWHKINLLNRGWSNHYSVIESTQANTPWPAPSQMYNIPLYALVPPAHRNLSDITEVNFAIFILSHKNHVIIGGTFDEIKKTYPAVFIEKNQSRTDIVLSATPHVLHSLDPTLIGIDQKAIRNPGIGRNCALSDISLPRYHSTLDFFMKHVNEEVNSRTSYNPKTLEKIIEQLKNSAPYPIEHQDVWLDGISHFPPTYRPPLRLSQNFQSGVLNDQALEAYNRAEIVVTKISDKLYVIGVPLTKDPAQIDPQKYLHNAELQALIYSS
jgi:hypothetical protein